MPNFSFKRAVGSARLLAELGKSDIDPAAKHVLRLFIFQFFRTTDASADYAEKELALLYSDVPPDDEEPIEAEVISFSNRDFVVRGNDLEEDPTAADHPRDEVRIPIHVAAHTHASTISAPLALTCVSSTDLPNHDNGTPSG